MAGQNNQANDGDGTERNNDVDPSLQENEEQETVREEYDFLDSKLDELNSALDMLEQKNDDIREKLKELLQSNINIRQELQNENKTVNPPK